MQENKSKIAVLVPCYNESKTIAKVVADFKAALPEATVYVYDNNSTDGTDEIARGAGAEVRYEHRQGKGNVIRSMFRDIDADCYLMIDGDDTYPADHAREMCRLVLEDGCDMVIGDRLSGTYFQENKRPFHNFGNVLVRRLINYIFHSDVKDIMTGYRAFSRPFVKHFPVLSKGFEIETEMTIHALDKNFYLREIPVMYRDRPAGSVSKLNTYKDGFKVLLTISATTSRWLSSPSSPCSSCWWAWRCSCPCWPTICTPAWCPVSPRSSPPASWWWWACSSSSRAWCSRSSARSTGSSSRY